MSGLIIKGGKHKLIGEISLPGDKSISHRSVMLGALAEGTTTVKNILFSKDVIRTIEAFRNMGVDIKESENLLRIEGVGLKGLKKPKEEIDCGNSGTTARLLAGILVGQNFSTTMIGDESLSNRPMDRIIIPLSKMGGLIKGREDKYLPLEIQGIEGKLKGIEYTLPVASAQVKSSILLASLYSESPTRIMEGKPTRDHTERMLTYFGCPVQNINGNIFIKPPAFLKAQDIYVPGDISSAAYFMVAASIVKGSNITIKNVGINPTRTGIIQVLKEMGADINIFNKRALNNEPFADIEIKYSPLKGIIISGDIIATLIDEIPIIAVAATLAEGRTIIRDAQELKYKESNRIAVMVRELNKMGAFVRELPDGMIIEGKATLKGGILNSYKDHRIAMALSIAALRAEGESIIKDHECVNISYPGFFNALYNLFS